MTTSKWDLLDNEEEAGKSPGNSYDDDLDGM